METNSNKVEIGTLGTISIGSDRYAAKVVATTTHTVTAEFLYGGQKSKRMTFRYTLDGLRYKRYYHLALGEAIQQMDEGF